MKSAFPLPVWMCVVVVGSPFHGDSGSVHTAPSGYQVPSTLSHSVSIPTQFVPSPLPLDPVQKTLESEQLPAAQHISLVAWLASEHDPATPGP